MGLLVPIICLRPSQISAGTAEVTHNTAGRRLRWCNASCRSRAREDNGIVFVAVVTRARAGGRVLNFLKLILFILSTFSVPSFPHSSLSSRLFYLSSYHILRRHIVLHCHRRHRRRLSLEQLCELSSFLCASRI